MALKRFTNGDKLKADQINYDENISILDAIFPIGRGFIDFTNTDYSNYLGFTWERELVGLTPVGYKTGDSDFGSIGKKGGEKQHILTINEMPAHKHNPSDIGATWVPAANMSRIQIYESSSTGKYTPIPENGADGWKWGSTSSTGGSQPHNNMPPYQVVAYWKRIA